MPSFAKEEYGCNQGQDMGRFWRIFTFKRCIFYGFPIYLLIAEYAIRFLLSYAPGKPEDLEIVATTSTITAAGLSLIAPVLIPKPVTQGVGSVDPNILPIRVKDHRLINLAYLALFVLPFAWGLALWMVHTGANYPIGFGGVRLPAPFLIALAIYLVGMVSTEFKEVV